MKIGYAVEGSTDEAFLVGLRDRWCPDAELVSLGFRGSTLRHRDYSRILKEAQIRELDVIVFLTDSNNRNWNDVVSEEQQQLSQTGGYNVLLGVAERNIECWLCSDVDYIATQYPCNREELHAQDPKWPFQRALGISRDDKKQTEIAALIRDVPSLRIWLSRSRSLAHFYDEVRRLAAERGCQIPDERAPIRSRRRRNSQL